MKKRTVKKTNINVVENAKNSKYLYIFIFLLLVMTLISGCQKENNENGKLDQAVGFSIEMKVVHDFTDEIIEKVQNELKENEWVTSNFYLNGKTYVLLGSPKQGKKLRIDIDGFKIDEEKIIIYYQTFDFHEEPIGLKKHLLYEFDGEYKIEFLMTYSTEQ